MKVQVTTRGTIEDFHDNVFLKLSKQPQFEIVIFENMVKSYFTMLSIGLEKVVNSYL